MWPWRAGGKRRLLFMSSLISHPFLHTLPSPWPSKVSSAFTDFETLHSVAFFSINLLSINYNNIWYILMLYLSFSLLNPFIWTKYKDFYLLPTCCGSVTVVSNFLWPHGLQHAGLPCPSPPPGVSSNPCPLSQWCRPTILPSVAPFSFCPQSFPASMSFPVSWLLCWIFLQLYGLSDLVVESFTIRFEDSS